MFGRKTTTKDVSDCSAKSSTKTMNSNMKSGSRSTKSVDVKTSIKACKARSCAGKTGKNCSNSTKACHTKSEK